MRRRRWHQWSLNHRRPAERAPSTERSARTDRRRRLSIVDVATVFAWDADNPRSSSIIPLDESYGIYQLRNNDGTQILGYYLGDAEVTEAEAIAEWSKPEWNADDFLQYVEENHASLGIAPAISDALDKYLMRAADRNTPKGWQLLKDKATEKGQEQLGITIYNLAEAMGADV